MNITLSSEEKTKLERQHADTKERRHPDRIKSILLRNEGWS